METLNYSLSTLFDFEGNIDSKILPEANDIFRAVVSVRFYNHVSTVPFFCKDSLIKFLLDVRQHEKLNGKNLCDSFDQLFTAKGKKSYFACPDTSEQCSFMKHVNMITVSINLGNSTVKNIIIHVC